MVIFRRLGSALRLVETREWVLLALETIAVFVSIVVAFELNEWASRRHDAARRHEMLDRLFEESRRTVAGLDTAAARMKAMTDAERAFATALVHERTCPPAPAWAAADTLPMYPAITVPTSVYQEMMGAGGLASIDDPDARRAVSEFHALLAWAQSQTDYFRANVTPAYVSDDPHVAIDYDPSREEPQVTRFDRRPLCASRAFRNRIAAGTRDHRIVYELRAGLLAKARTMCAALGSLLRRRCDPPAPVSAAP